MFGLELGDKLVKVRKRYQNYDHTMIPCEPEVYTINWIGSGDIAFEETVRQGFRSDDDGRWLVPTGELSNSRINLFYVSYEDYIKGNYNKDIILDKDRWKGGLEEFLEFKRTNDQKIAREIEDKRKKVLMNESR